MTSRGQYAKTAGRRDQIVTAALDAFALEGFRGTSLQEIADKVGITKAGLLHHFSSKEELLLAVLSLREKSYALTDDVRGLAGVLQHLRTVVEVDSATEGLVALYVTLSAEATNPKHPAHDYFVERYRVQTASIADRLQQAVQDGELLGDVDAQAAAHQLFAMLDGLQLHWLLNPNIDRVKEFDLYIRQFLNTFATNRELDVLKPGNARNNRSPENPKLTL
jgi:AcrR family transcriptional regulator